MKTLICYWLWTLVLVLPRIRAQSSSLPSSTGSNTRSSSAPRTESTASTTPAPTGTASFITTQSVVGNSTIPITVAVPAQSTSAVSATFTTYPTLSGIPVCVTQCLQVGVSDSSCATIVDVTCYCGRPSFSNSTTNCVARNCPDHVLMAQGIAQEFCNIASVSLTFPPAPTPTTVTQITTTPSATATRSNMAPKGLILDPMLLVLQGVFFAFL